MRISVSLALVAILCLAGCGGRDTSDRQVDSLSRDLSSSQGPFGAPMQKDQARCVAKVYLESDLDDASLAPLKRGEPPAPSSPEEAKKLSKISTKISEDCLSQ